MDNDLLTAYKNAEYVVFADGLADNQFVMLVDKYCDALQRLMYQKDCKQAAFITAYNPRSHLLPESQNRNAHTHLKNQIQQLGFKFINGQGQDPKGHWPAEKSLLVLNIDKHQAMNIAKQWGQNALIWIEDDAIPNLLLIEHFC
ncbi:DUF3293 domain-containing protein [Alteromonas sp. M12]|uniref:DUF3293 domain-containing protein n=1 Tax=Alteromonas sp. M12 TaxID=3135644 RepID=UPI00319E1E8E